MSAYAVDNGGRLTFVQSLSTVQAGAAGNTAAEVVLFGSRLYGSNRGDDSIVVYSIGADGLMTLQGTRKTGGMTPRSFTIDPSGRWLLVANQDSNEVRVFSLDPTMGLPQPTSVRVSVTAPAFVGIF
jgi:6-phosphogluconolactonase